MIMEVTIWLGISRILPVTVEIDEKNVSGHDKDG